jgi:hypothetical protein
MKRPAIVAFSLAGFVLAGPARADNLTGADRFICSAGSVSVCCDDGACASGTAAEVGVPQFMEFDLVQKRISTTKASGLNRVSAIDNVKRANGQIVVQGIDNGRAYSFAINEMRGEMSAAVAVEEAGCSIIGFGACTPIASGK